MVRKVSFITDLTHHKNDKTTVATREGMFAKGDTTTVIATPFFLVKIHQEL